MSYTLIGKHEKDSRANRDGYVSAMLELMEQDSSIVHIDCDLMGCINTGKLCSLAVTAKSIDLTTRYRLACDKCINCNKDCHQKQYKGKTVPTCQFVEEEPDDENKYGILYNQLP